MSPNIFNPPEWMPAAFDCPKCHGRVFYFMQLPRAEIQLIKCSACPWQENPRSAQREARRISRLSPNDLMAYHNAIFHPEPEPDPLTHPNPEPEPQQPRPLENAP